MGYITFLPLDLTGNLRRNLREAETHTLIKVGNRVNRVCVLNHGAFYTKNLLVRDATGRALTPKVDYTTTYNYNDLSNVTAKEIMGIVVVTNPAVQSPIAVTYQAVGGAFSVSVKELKAIIEALKSDDFTLKWEDIVGKPTAYTPDDHEHEWWQVFGMETTVTEIDRIREAWRYSTTAVVNENKNFGDVYLLKANQAVDLLEFNVRAHLAYKLNAHQLNKDQVGLSYVNNWIMATDTLVLNRNADSEYFPIGGMYRVLNTGALTDLNAHIRNTNNPHGVIAADANVLTKVEIDSLFNAKYLLTDIATDATTYELRNTATVRIDATIELNTNDLVSGMFHANQIGLDSDKVGDPKEWTLCGDGVFRKWSDLMKTYNDSRHRMITLGGTTASGTTSALAMLRTYYTTPAYPAGTYAFTTVIQNPTPDVVFDLLYIYQRVGNDWQLIF